MPVVLQLTDTSQPDIKSIQIQLKGFLENKTEKFCKDLWNMCLSAQENAQGVPQQLLEAKKLEIQKQMVRRAPLYRYRPILMKSSGGSRKGKRECQPAHRALG